jgi:hypothetical protein
VAKLTNTEKFTLQGMVVNGMTPEQMADQINRPVHVVKRYLDGELNKIHETIASIQLERSKKTDDQDEKTADDAIINQDKQPQPKILKSKDLFVTTTAEKRDKGVAISNEAVSMRGDEHRKKIKRVVSRHASKNLYRISDGKVLEQGDDL